MSSTSETMQAAFRPPDTTGKTGWKKYFAIFIYVLRIVAVLALILDLIAYILQIKIGVGANNLDAFEKAMNVLSNTGFILLIIALILAELQFVWFLEKFRFLHYWGGRGFGQLWCGIQMIASIKTLSSALASELSGDSKTLATFCQVTGWILASIGLLYILMSLMCLRGAADLKADEKLEQAFLSRSGTTTNVKHETHVVTGSSKEMEAAQIKLKKEVEDLEMLVGNLSTACGVSLVVAKSKFGGRAGSQAAADFQRDVARKEEQLKKAGQNFASSASSMASSAHESAKNAVESTTSSISMPSSSSSSSSAGGGGGSYSPASVDAEEESGGRRGKRGGMSDDELMAAYYGKN